MNYIVEVDKVRQAVDKLQSEIKRLHHRLAEHGDLVRDIEYVIADSESKMASEIQDLIDKHYEL